MTASSAAMHQHLDEIMRRLTDETMAAIDIYDISTDAQEPDDYQDTTVGDVRESIETNMWLAEAYFAHGAAGLGRECLAAAWKEYTRYQELLLVACGPTLGDKLRAMVIERCPDILTEGTK